MDDFRHLRKAHKDDEKESLLGDELSPVEAKECLDTMKEIAALIERVCGHYQFGLLIYYCIGSHYILEIRVSLPHLLYYWFRCALSTHRRKRDWILLHYISLHYWRIHIYPSWIYRDENCSLYQCKNHKRMC